MSDPDAEFLAIFRDEATDRLDRIVETLLALEASTAGADAVDSLFRDTHTIKGAAGMVGLDEVRALAHAMEDVLAEARSDGELPAALIEPLLRCSDALRQHVDGGGEPTAALVDELHRALPVIHAEQHAGSDEPVAVPAAPAPTPVEPAATPVEPAAASESAVSTGRPAIPSTGAQPERRAIRVPAEKIDALLDLVGETVLHRQRLEHGLTSAEGGAERQLADELDVGEQLLDELQHAAIGMRTLPLSTITAPLPRAVRDLGVETGKDVELVVTGAETELDRVILESLPDLLVHLLRNAIGHGIETREERESAGKPARGRLEVRAEQRGGDVEVTVADDGRGVSRATLDEARRAGSLTDVLTRPGFSTASEVSGISGRGVGLDAVKEQVEAFGGRLEVRSEPGRGTDIVLRLPLALALIDVLLVERAGSVFGFPLGSVEEAVSLGETLSLGGQPAIELRGSAIAVADLALLTGGTGAPPELAAPVVVVSAAGKRIGVICDELIGKEEVVVKSLGSLLSGLEAYLGAAILGDGRIALLIDPAVLVRAAARSVNAGQVGAASAPKVLVVEDSLTIRELQRSILEAAGYRVQTAQHGREALVQLDRDDGIDLVVTDVEMPEMDGIELTKTIRTHPDRATLPVVIVTTLGDEADRKRGIDAGADAYMVKRAFDQHDLLDTVGRLVGR